MKKLASLKLMLVILLLINFLPAGCVYTPPISPEWPSDTAEEDFYIQVGKHLKNFETVFLYGFSYHNKDKAEKIAAREASCKLL